MLRAVLLGVLAITAACGKSSNETVAAKSQPGVAAGKVLEVKGSVSVKHADATRAVAPGDSVEAEDLVITGADGNVVIELAHNSARWELGPNKQQQVNQSIAWNAQKAVAEDVEQATAAAGRPAERSAAGTVATADEAPPREPECVKPEPDQAAPAPPPSRSRAAAGPPPPPVVQPAAPPPSRAAQPAGLVDDSAPPARTRRGAVERESALDAPSGGRGGAAAPGGAPGAPAAAAAPVADRARAAAPTPAAAAVAAPASASAPAAAAAPVSAASLVTTKTPALHQCLVDAGVKADVTVTIAFAAGKATVTLAGSVTPALETCIKGVVSGIHFAGTDKVVRVVKP